MTDEVNADEWLSEHRVRCTDWTDPLVSSSPWGGFVMEWWAVQRKLTVYVSPNGDADFVKVWGADVSDTMEIGDVGSDTSFESLWQWLRGE